MTSVAPPRDAAGTAPGGPSWPARSGTVPALADGYTQRQETAPDLAAALPPGTAVALVSGRTAGAGQAGVGQVVPGQVVPGQAGAGQAGAGQADPGQEADSDPGDGGAARDWLGSSGKTQLAAAFAESLWHSGGLDLLVWVQATSRAAVLSGYAAATATATGREQASSCESVAAQFLGWLSETSRSWLVVLDGVADPADLDGLWPSGPNGRVLVTSTEAAGLPRRLQVLPVGLFNSREALGYLMERLSANPGQRLGAIDLVRSIDLEPAALTQASAVIASSTMSCHGYCEYFLRRRDQLTDASGAPPPASAVTWTISFERASQLAPGGSAQPVLALAALLDGNGIPVTALTAPAAGGYVAGAGADASGEAVHAALAALERTGLLTLTPAAPPMIRINPVLQSALRAAMPEAMLDQAVKVAADALLQAWPEAGPLGWPASGLRSCAAALRQAAGDRLWSAGCHPVLLRAGDSLDHARLTGPAVDHWSDLLATSDRLLGSGHPHTVLAGQRLAEAQLAADRPDDGVASFQRLLDIQSVRLGPNHQEVVEARRRLGHALVAAGQLDRAVSVLEKVVTGAERVNGDEHVDTTGARDELAAAYLAAGRHSEAINLYRRTLADREVSQGSRHPETMTTRQCLADAYLASGQAKEAVTAYKRVVADRERTLGPDHLDTNRARYSLGTAYLQTGKTVAAERVYEQAKAGFERALGPRHPDALRSRAQLARAYHQLGRYGDARALLRDTVDRLDRILPYGDPLIADLRAILADIGDE